MFCEEGLQELQRVLCSGCKKNNGNLINIPEDFISKQEKDDHKKIIVNVDLTGEYTTDLEVKKTGEIIGTEKIKMVTVKISKSGFVEMFSDNIPTGTGHITYGNSITMVGR